MCGTSPRRRSSIHFSHGRRGIQASDGGRNDAAGCAIQSLPAPDQRRSGGLPGDQRRIDGAIDETPAIQSRLSAGGSQSSSKSLLCLDRRPARAAALEHENRVIVLSPMCLVARTEATPSLAMAFVDLFAWHGMFSAVHCERRIFVALEPPNRHPTDDSMEHRGNEPPVDICGHAVQAV